MDKFKDGQELQGIYFPQEQQLVLHQAVPELGRVKSIVVIMENGQMDGVPWFQVTFTDGTVQKWNGALVDGVCLLKKEPPND